MFTFNTKNTKTKFRWVVSVTTDGFITNLPYNLPNLEDSLSNNLLLSHSQFKDIRLKLSQTQIKLGL
jgi:hypothetical protein